MGPTLQKTPAHLVFQGFLGIQPRFRVWKRLRVGGHPFGADVDAKRRCSHQHFEGRPVVSDRVGAG